MAFTLITVTGTYEKNDGTAAAGTVSFVLSAALQDSSTGNIHAPVLTSATLNGSGAFSVTLVANDDTTTTPTGSSYKVTEQITGATPRSYNVIIPHTAAGGTVALASLAPTTTTANLSYALTSNNLSDLTNVPVARTNLGLGSIATHAASEYAALTGATFTGGVQASLTDSGGQVHNALAAGAKADAITLLDGVATNNSATFTSASASFTAADVGKTIVINGADSGRSAHATTIASVVSATQITLTAAATASVTGAQFFYGTDSTSVLNTLISTVNAAGGGIVLLPPGSYMAVGINLLSGVHLQGSGKESTTIIKADNLGGTYIVQALGSLSTPSVAPTADIAQRSNSITVSSASGFAVGDYVLLYDCTYKYLFTTVTDGAMTQGTSTVSSATANWTSGYLGNNIVVPGAGPGGVPICGTIQSVTDSSHVVVDFTASTTVSGASVSFGCGGRNQEMARITGISGSTLTLATYTRGSYALASGALVRKCLPVTNAQMSNLALVNSSTGTLSHSGGPFLSRLAYGLRISGCKAVRPSEGAGFQLQQTQNARLLDCSAYDGIDPSSGGQGYAWQFNESCIDCQAIGCYHENCREAPMTNNARDCSFVACVAQSPYDDGFNTHGSGTENCSFVGCHVLNSRGDGITVGFGTDLASDIDVLILGCKVVNCGGAAIAVNSDPGGLWRNNRVSAIANIIDGFGTYGVFARLTDHCQVIANTITNNDRASGSAALSLQYLRHSRCAGNIVHNVDFCHGIEMLNLSDTVVEGNDISGTGSGLLEPVSGTNDFRLVIRNNQFDRAWPNSGYYPAWPANDGVSIYDNFYLGVRQASMMPTKAGVPTDADTLVAADGMFILDTTDNKLYVRVGGVWKAATLT